MDEKKNKAGPLVEISALLLLAGWQEGLVCKQLIFSGSLPEQVLEEN